MKRLSKISRPNAVAAFAALAAIGLTAAQTSLAIETPERVLTAEQAAQVALWTTERADQVNEAGPPPTRQFTETVVFTREDALAAIDKILLANGHIWDRVAREAGQLVASRAREGQRALLVKEALGIPPAGIKVDVPSVEVGTHSISFGSYQFRATSGGPKRRPNYAQSDPINLVFWDHGSSAEVESRMRNHASTRWENDASGRRFTVETTIGNHEIGARSGSKTSAQEESACTYGSLVQTFPTATECIPAGVSEQRIGKSGVRGA